VNRYRFAHTVMDRGWFNDPDLLKKETKVAAQLMALGYTEVARRNGTMSEIVRYKASAGTTAKPHTAQIVYGFRVTLNAPLSHHNAIRTVLGRPKLTEQEAIQRSQTHTKNHGGK